MTHVPTFQPGAEVKAPKGITRSTRSANVRRDYSEGG